MQDVTVVEAAKNGDEHAFYQLVASEKKKLYGIAYSYLKNEHDALEAIQEMTCRAYLKINNLKNPAYFQTWLIRILINYCIDEQKRKKKVLFLEKDQEDEQAGTHFTGITMEDAVDALEKPYKQVIILKYFHDMTNVKIAETLDRPEGTIKTWVNRALKQLRKSLGREDEGNV